MFHGYAPIVDGLFILNLEQEPVYNMNIQRHKPNEINPTYFWHCRLGHISLKCMKKLHDDGLLTSSDFGSFETCESCLLGKMTKSPFAKSCERASKLLELIHSDVCGPMSTTAKGGYQYFVTLPTTWVDMDISIWWGTSQKLLKSSKSFRTRLRISSAWL